MLKGKHIILGVTGSIAAYKAAMLVRLLVREGAEVRVIMTDTAKKFIAPLTMAVLSKNPVLVEFFNPENGEWNSHVALGLWADLYLIAPATANTLSKMACGISDNLLLTTYLSVNCHVMAAPAMDSDMFVHPATRKSLETLSERGIEIVEPASGELASGLEGKGRMEEPENILQRVKDFFEKKFKDEEKLPLKGKKALITSGPTCEAIDPVRYFTNASSGKMASAIAEKLALKGAEVTVVSGRAEVKPAGERINVIDVVSADEMYDATLKQYKEGADIVVLCAAVADYAPIKVSPVKLKKGRENLIIEMKPTKDIAAAIGENKREGDVVVGFALETDNELSNAKSKLERKNMDMIVLNSLKDKGAGFSGDTNKISILFKSGEILEFPLKSKKAVASDIADNIEKLLPC